MVSASSANMSVRALVILVLVGFGAAGLAIERLVDFLMMYDKDRYML